MCFIIKQAKLAKKFRRDHSQKVSAQFALFYRRISIQRRYSEMDTNVHKPKKTKRFFLKLTSFHLQSELFFDWKSPTVDLKVYHIV